MTQPKYRTAPGPPSKKYPDHRNDIENQKTEEHNNEKLNQLCKNICLIIGWSLVFCLIFVGRCVIFYQ